MRKATFIVMLGVAVAVMAGMSPIKWKTTSIDLGQIPRNEIQRLSFEFTNTTDQAIRIIDAKGSCGCTKVQFPKTEIAPGSSAAISANFSSGREGAFKKNIRIQTSESEQYTYLYFAGEVVE